MPIGIVDAFDGSVLVGHGWQDICVLYHRADPRSAERCRESDETIKAHLREHLPCEYLCKNGLRDIGVPIEVEGEHVATLFLGQFFYEGECPDRQFFARQAREFGFPEEAYLAALDRVPVFSRSAVENILQYDVALARFISELAERALAHVRSDEALREAERRKGEFIATLSHELRNPLAPIQNALYVLGRAGPESDQGRRALGVANRQIRHLTRIVDDLMDVMRFTRGKYRVRRERLDLAQLVRESLEDHRSTFVARAVRLDLADPGEPVWVDGDGTRLSQVLGNLLRNAAKFTDAGGSVVVSVEHAEAKAVVRVRDDGIGIPPHLLETVFEPLVQGDATLDRAGGGLGLGLALVKSLVELHGGSVRARSEGEGRGAELTVTLPLAPPSA
jgi:signal transduction histidine kinase